MSTAFDNGGGGYERQLCFLLQFCNGKGTTVAHGRLNFGTGFGYVFFQRTCIRYIGVDAFFKLEFLFSTEIIAAPVACSVGTFAPVFFYYRTADGPFLCRRFVETRNGQSNGRA